MSGARARVTRARPRRHQRRTDWRDELRPSDRITSKLPPAGSSPVASRARPPDRSCASVTRWPVGPTQVTVAYALLRASQVTASWPADSLSYSGTASWADCTVARSPAAGALRCTSVRPWCRTVMLCTTPVLGIATLKCCVLRSWSSCNGANG